MAEGSYGSPFYQGAMSPIEPGATPSPYKANVSRKKTRKWVEAKKVNYDGSGWGDDDDDEEDDTTAEAAAAPTPSPAPPMPSLPHAATFTSGLRALPSMNAAPPAAATPPPSTRPPLHTTLSDQGMLPWRAPSNPDTHSSLPSQTGPDTNTPRSGSQPPSGRRWPTDDVRSQSPLGPRAQSPATAGRRPGNFIRPSDIYRRGTPIEETTSSPPVARSSGDATAPESFARKEDPVAPAPPPVQAAPVVPPSAPSAPSVPTVPTVQLTQPQSPEQKRSASGSVFTATTAPAAQNLQTHFYQTQHHPQDSVDSTGSSGSQDDAQRRFSNFPKLPSLARFSTFAPDLSSLLSDDDAPPMPALPTTAFSAPATPAAPLMSPVAASASATATATATADNAQTARRLSDEVPKKHPTDSFSSASASVAATARDSSFTTATSATGFSDDAPVTSPQDRSASPAAASATTAATTAAMPQITPTAPLNPHRISIADLSAVSALHTNLPRSSTDTAASSATPKDNDKLHEEIIRTLGPTADGTTSTETPATASTAAAADHDGEDDARAGDGYLQSVYDEYWNDGSGDEADPPAPSATIFPLSPIASSAQKAPMPEEPKAEPVSVPVAAPVAAPVAPVVPVTAPVTAPVEPKMESPPIPAKVAILSVPAQPSPNGAAKPKEASPMSPVDGSAPSGTFLRRRFSWEAGSEAPAAESASTPPTVPVSPAAAAATSSLAKAHLSVGPSIPVELDAGSPALSAASGDVLSPRDVSDDLPELATPEDAQRAAHPPIRSMLDIGLDDLEAVEAVLSGSPTGDHADHADHDDRVSSPVEGQARASVLSAGSGQSSQAAHPPPNPATYLHHEGMGNMLTLRQCMAYDTHSERMVKLAETRREYANADSGLLGWLGHMTTAPEYAKASYLPLWDAPPSPSQTTSTRPTIIIPQHVNIPSSAHLQHKGKEILAATGKAGKGLFALRKKGFHKKAAN